MSTPSYIVDAAADALRQVAEAIGPAGADVAADADALVHTPAALAKRLNAAAATLTAAPDAAAALHRLSLPAPPSGTAWRRHQATLQNALEQLARTALTLALARAHVRSGYADRTAARDARDAVVDAIDDLLPGAGARTTAALRAVRAALVAHVRAALPALPEVTALTPAAVEPSLVVAWRLDGHVGRAGDVAARNRLPRPGFIPARPIEVTT